MIWNMQAGTATIHLAFIHEVHGLNPGRGPGISTEIFHGFSQSHIHSVKHCSN